MTNKINLWNLGEGKTKETLKYINSLEPKHGWKHSHWYKEVAFEKLIQEAKQKSTANEMLEVIQFNPSGVDGIYHYIERLNRNS
jgi:hypothetical protein